ncbi:MAG: ORF1 protein [Anelloviridae sp.]|nr:MAG: ORF1 protein [Anelloviridae sp.]
MGYYTPRQSYGRRYRRRNFIPHFQRRHHFRRRRYYPRRRRYRHRRRSTEVLREHKPRKQKWITVYGWEILGVCGTTWFWTDQGKLEYRQNIKNNQPVSHLSELGILTTNAKPNFTGGEKCEFKHFCGGHGQATITLAGLAERARLGMARFSENFEGYTWIKFLGAKFQLVPANEVDYLFKLNNRAPYKTDPEKAAETKWNHPANLLLHRGVRVVESIQRSKCCKWKTIKYKPPTEFEGWYDIDNFASFQLLQYMWTTISLTNPMGIAPYAQTGLPNEDTGQIVNKWWKEGCTDKSSNLHIPQWIDRVTYDSAFLTKNENKWWNNIFSDTGKPKHSPFCPPVFTTTHPNTLWCRYKFWFKVGGSTIQNYLPLYPIQEIGPPPSTCSTSCTACIKEGDLDPDGILTESSYRRITEPHHQSRRRLLEKFKRKLRMNIHK